MGNPDDYRLEDGDGFVRVALHCRLGDKQDALRLVRDVDAALARTGFDLVMFDYRGIEHHVDEVRDVMWTWAAARALRAIALVVDGEMTRVRTNMIALSRKVRLRAFMDEAEARDWLRHPTRRTRETPQV